MPAAPVGTCACVPIQCIRPASALTTSSPFSVALMCPVVGKGQRWARGESCCRLLLAVVIGAQGQGKGESLTSCTWGGLPGWAACWRLTLLTSTCPTHVLHHGDNRLPRTPLQGESWGSPGQSPLQLPQASDGT